MSLIPITVHGIPSMRNSYSSFISIHKSLMFAFILYEDICLEFIPELISLPQPEKKLFGIHLAAHLMEKVLFLSLLRLQCSSTIPDPRTSVSYSS